MIGAVVCVAMLFALPPAEGDVRLNGLLRELFLANTNPEREVIARKVLEIKGLTPKKLGEAIRGLQLWAKQPAGVQQLAIRSPEEGAEEMQVWVSVPKKYTPRKRWPVLIALHGQGGRADAMLAFAQQLLDQRADEFIIAAPQDIGPIGLTSPVEVVARPRELISVLRRRFHIDNDRVYLTGYSQGSHDAWMTVIMYPDYFAGVVPLATPLQVPGGTLLYDELLPNAQNVPILFCWGARDNVDEQGKVREDGGNAALNRKLSELISHLSFRHFEFVEIPGVGHQDVLPPAKQFSALLDRKREHYPKLVRQAFRLPLQSDAYWVSADRLSGEPLPDGKLEIPVAQGEDPLAAEKKWLVGQLGLAEARCDGQTITLTTRKAGNVIVLLSPDLIDFDKPVTIIRNNRKRLERKIDPDLRVMLVEAARSWDFDRLPQARLVIPVGGSVKVGYPRLKVRLDPAEQPEKKGGAEKKVQGKPEEPKGDKKE